MINLKSARRAGVPLVVVETADAQQTIMNISAGLNGNAKDVPILRWDVCRALTYLNAAGKAAIENLVDDPEQVKIATQNPTECLALLEKAPEKTLVFFMNAQLFWKNETVLQGIWNLRDVFKSGGQTLVLLCSLGSSMLPDELKQDCIVLTDTLPSEQEIAAIVNSLLTDAGMKVDKLKDKERIYDTLLGLSAFAAEQVLAMSLSKEGIDRDGLWERKRKMIEQTPGLSVWRGGETFDDIGGYENVKSFMRAICKGNKPPRAIVFIDEIEKSMAGSQSDTSGVSQDYLRSLLTFMQDKDAMGVIFIGPPGSAKSVTAKATGNEAGVPTIALDLGGMKGSLVGESERRLRTALQIVEAVSQGSMLFIATCNSIGILPPELRRRFNLGTFFFPLPTPEDRPKIWDIWMKKFGLDGEKPKDAGWTGAEIRNCCTTAWRLKSSLKRAAEFIVPVSVSAGDQIEKLCREAHNRYISASESGLFSYDKELAIKTTVLKRKLGE